MRVLWHALLLFFAFGLVFVWEQTSLAGYTVQFLAILVLAYFIFGYIRKKHNPTSEPFGNASDIFILTSAILLIINLTGNLYSPLFFLLYFLGFGITFIFEPVSVFIFTIATVLIFLPQALKNNSLESYIRLGSVVLISPLAYFFGMEFNQRVKLDENLEMKNERVKEVADTIEKDVNEVLDKDKGLIDPIVTEKLNEILDETTELHEEAKQN